MGLLSHKILCSSPTAGTNTKNPLVTETSGFFFVQSKLSYVKILIPVLLNHNTNRHFESNLSRNKTDWVGIAWSANVQGRLICQSIKSRKARLTTCFSMELLIRIELMTSSLPRMRSTI